MKKFHPFLLSILLVTTLIFTSCNKSGILQQDTPTTAENDLPDGSARNHGCNPPPPPPPDCPPPPNCPSTVPEATDISYAFNWTDLQHIGIEADITYNNPDAAGTFRVVLRTVTNEIDSIIIIPALITGAGQTATFHVTFNDLAYESFPCTLHVNGRPANLQQCPARSRISFPIDFNVSKR
jgi:hypothetical protein